MASNTVTGASPYWAVMYIKYQASPPAHCDCYEVMRIDYEYSPALLAIMKRKWFFETWEAENVFNRARIERLEALARKLGVEVRDAE